MGILDKLFGAIKTAADQAKKEIATAANALEGAAGKLADAVEDECIGLDTAMQQGETVET